MERQKIERRILMKKLSKEMRLRRLRFQRRLARRAKKHRSHLNKKLRKQTVRLVYNNPALRRLTAPTVFSIESDETRGPVVEFLAQLREAFSLKEVNKVVIDLSATTRFISSATLLFYAELSRLLQYCDNRVQVRCKPPRNEKACQVLHQIGLYKMCGQPIKRRRSFYADVVHWRVASGHMVDNSICAVALEEFEGQLALPLVHGIYRGLGEAMTNAKHHAYLGTREDGLQYAPPHENWWMFSQARQGYLSVVFCDLGVGIPNTLPLKKPGLWEIITRRGRSGSDAACIEEAIEDSRTRTMRPERGRGLGNIVNVVSELTGGIVMVLSNRGFYFARNGSPTKTYNLRDSILGTLIFWRVPLGEETLHGTHSN